MAAVFVTVLAGGIYFARHIVSTPIDGFPGCCRDEIYAGAKCSVETAYIQGGQSCADESIRKMSGTSSAPNSLLMPAPERSCDQRAY